MNTVLQHPGFTILATALLHSLWLFTVPVVLDWLVTRRLGNAHHRYLSHLLTLLSWPLLFVFVLWSEWQATTGAWSEALLLEAELGTTVTLELTDNLQRLGITEAPRWTSYLALAYLLGLFVALTITLLRYRRTRKLRRGGWLPEPELRGTFAEIKARILPGRRVDWKITDRVATVLLVGIIHPVILFPVGLLNQLSSEEVAAVLRHELTHLKRYDTLWNAVQELLCALFFYHPLIYWLSAQLDLEREYACDDAVVRQTDKKIYARALLRVADHSLMPKQSLTMAAINTTSFTQRIQRLFPPANDAAVFARTGDNRSYLLPPLAILPLFLLLSFGTVGEHPYQLAGDATATAEEVVLTGKIYGGANAAVLIGATIISESGAGTITDLDGNYEIRLKTGEQKISISYVGYNSMVMEAEVTADAEIHFQLYADRPGKMRSMRGTFNFELLPATEMPKIRGGSAADLEDMPDNLLVIVDGKRKKNGSVKDLDASTITSIDVIKDKVKLAKLGYGTDFSGAILISTKE